jgi:hypothetical protein
MLREMPKAVGAKGNPGGQGAPIVRSHDATTQTTLADRAERRAGEMLAQMKETGERAAKGETKQPDRMSHDVTFAQTTLADLGVTRTQSSRWQKVAAIPEDDFEAALLA